MIAPPTQSLVTADGVRLDADVYYPPGDGPHPVLLMRQPYGRRIASTVTYAHPRWYARRGYIVVIQDVRGRGSSQGSFEPLINEREDGRQTLDWAAELPGSDGQVGMYGFSYQGMTQLLAAHTGHPALKAICPAMAGADLYRDWAYEGGVFRLFNSLTWAAQLAAETARREGDSARYADLYGLGHEPSSETLMAAMEPWVRERLGDSFFNDWIREAPDSDYWRARSAVPTGSATGPATLHIGGWYDAFLTGTLRTFEQFRAASGSPKHELVIGPWGHLPWTPQVGERDYGPAAESVVDVLQLAWFDRQLKGQGEPTQPHERVRLFDVEAGAWVAAPHWPLSTGSHELGLDSRGLAAVGANHGTLTGRATDGSELDTIVSDPWRPVPSHGGVTGPRGGRCERHALDARPDVATYTTEPLATDRIFGGSVQLQLNVAADVAVCHVHAVLSVVEPCGQAWHLTSGALRADGASGVVTLAMRPIFATIKAGKRLRLSIAGADWPAMALPHGSDSVPGAAAACDYPVVTLTLNDGEGTSRLVLPLVDAEEVRPWQPA